MSTQPRRRARPRLESLEARFVLSLPPSASTFGLTPPANTIGLSLGNVARAGAVASTTATISPQNITPAKASTEFAVFVQPEGNSGVVPRIVGVTENGRRLPIQVGRGYNPKAAGQAINNAVAFFETGTVGTVTILVAGKGRGTGAYTVETTLPGDVNGDGQVNLADAQAFAPTYATKPGYTGPNKVGYLASADYNHNGVVNLYDALALERNMTPLTKPGGGWAAVNLTPAETLPYPASRTSGGITDLKDITINGYTTPGSVVLVDSTLGNYKFASQAVATGANGFFTIPATNTQGINTYDFKILDPFGHQYIRSFPVFWTAYAKPDSKYVFKPSKKSPGGGRV